MLPGPANSCFPVNPINCDTIGRAAGEIYPVRLTICLIGTRCFDNSRMGPFVFCRRRYPSYCSRSA